MLYDLIVIGNDDRRHNHVYDNDQRKTVVKGNAFLSQQYNAVIKHGNNQKDSAEDHQQNQKSRKKKQHRRHDLSGCGICQKQKHCQR